MKSTFARRHPGQVRDAIVRYLESLGSDATVQEITAATTRELGASVAPSSVRSYLRLNAQSLFERTGRGRYQLALTPRPPDTTSAVALRLTYGGASLYQGNCLDWLAGQEPCSIHGVVTDPPYGLVEYTTREQSKLRNGRGGPALVEIPNDVVRSDLTEALDYTPVVTARYSADPADVATAQGAVQ